MKVPVSEIVSCNIVRMIIKERKKEIMCKRVKNRRKRERERKGEEETRE
jgi:hypothetical protein